jgi:hypothetical protein
MKLTWSHIGSTWFLDITGYESFLVIKPRMVFKFANMNMKFCEKTFRWNIIPIIYIGWLHWLFLFIKISTVIIFLDETFIQSFTLDGYIAQTVPSLFALSCHVGGLWSQTVVNHNNQQWTI